MIFFLTTFVEILNTVFDSTPASTPIPAGLESFLSNPKEPGTKISTKVPKI